jgi:prevent-host-death family protein
MLIVNVHDARTHLSRLIDRAVKGEGFIIAKAGKPLVRVTAIHSPAGRDIRRIGFVKGQIQVPRDFDRMRSSEIEELFHGGRSRG